MTRSGAQAWKHAQFAVCSRSGCNAPPGASARWRGWLATRNGIAEPGARRVEFMVVVALVYAWVGCGRRQIRRATRRL
jgi:hypothetical protein